MNNQGLFSANEILSFKKDVDEITVEIQRNIQALKLFPHKIILTYSSIEKQTKICGNPKKISLVQEQEFKNILMSSSLNFLQLIKIHHKYSQTSTEIKSNVDELRNINSFILKKFEIPIKEDGSYQIKDYKKILYLFLEDEINDVLSRLESTKSILHNIGIEEYRSTNNDYTAPQGLAPELTEPAQIEITHYVTDNLIRVYKGTAKNPRNEIKKYQPSDKKAYDLLALFAKPETKKLSYELPIKNICNYFNEDLSNQVHRRPSERYTKDLKLSDPLFQKKGEVIVFKGNKIKQTGIR